MHLQSHIGINFNNNNNNDIIMDNDDDNHLTKFVRSRKISISIDSWMRIWALKKKMVEYRKMHLQWVSIAIGKHHWFLDGTLNTCHSFDLLHFESLRVFFLIWFFFVLCYCCCCYCFKMLVRMRLCLVAILLFRSVY